MTSTYRPVVSAAQVERDLAHERKIVAASLEMVDANTKEGQQLAWQRLRALILKRSTSQILKMEFDLGLANLRAGAVPLQFRSAKVAA